MRLICYAVLFSIITFVSGCSNPEQIIRVGEPTVGESDTEREYTIEGCALTHEIQDEDVVNEIKGIIEQIDSVDQPDIIISEPPEVFFELFEPDNFVAIFRYYLWYRAEGGAILEDSNGNYFSVDKEQAENLKEALE